MNQNYSPRVCAYVDLDAVRWNLSQIKKAVRPNTQIIAVIKADGYGHGAIPIAKAAEPLDYVWGFAVAVAEEAFSLRAAGISKPILILGYTFPKDYEKLCAQQVSLTVFSYQMALEMSRVALSLGRVLDIHLALDTGMTRIGFADTPASVEECKKIAALPGLSIQGLFTHFARADEYDDAPAKAQLERYQKFAGALKAAGVKIPLCHCSNSAGILNLPEANLDLCRAGIILYGLLPSAEVRTDGISLRPAMEIKSRIVHLQEAEAGIPISYGGTYITKKRTRVATIPVGYADGYPRSLSNKGYVFIHGKPAPILGRICMDQFMVDVTQIPEAQLLDQVTLAGADGDRFLSLEELGDLSGRFNYEFACGISARVPRVYRNA